jgi:hypothetical protein
MNLEISQVTRQCEEAAQKMVTQFTEAQLRANSLDELIEAVIAEKVPGTIVLDLEGHQIDNEVVPTPRGPILGTPPYGGQHPAESIKALLHIPWSGNRQAFTFRPYHSLQQQNPEADITDREVVLFVVAYPGTPGDVTQKHLLDQQQILQQWVERVNGDIAGVERLVRAKVRSQLAERQRVQRQRDAMIGEFTIPVRQVAADWALEVPVRRTTVVLRGSAPTGTNGEPEWSLADSVYEQIIRTITGLTRAMELRPASANRLLPDEETLRDFLMFMLGGNYEAPDGADLFVGGETVNGKGKTDLLIRHRDKNAFIGECKFWDGPSKFDEAIEQLLSYVVWRDTKAALILFIKNRDATAVIDTAGSRLASHAACVQAPVSSAPCERRDYRLASPHDDQRMISLALLPVVVRAI